MYEFKETSLCVMEKPFEKSKPLHNQHDKGYKYLLSSRKVFIELLKCFVKEGWVHNVHQSSVVRIDKSFILHDFEEKESDLIYRLKVKDQEIIFYVLMELSNLIGSVFMLDKKIGASDELSNKLVRLINVLKHFTSEDMTLFKNWFKIISTKNLPPDDQKEIENILESEKGVESMVYAIEKFMKEEFERQHESGKSEGIQEGIDKEAENSRQRSIKSVKNLLTKKFGSLSPEVIGKLQSAESDGLLRIIDNIFDLESLDNALKLL